MDIEELADRFILTGATRERDWFRQLVAQAQSIPLYAASGSVATLRRAFLEFAKSPLARSVPQGVTTIELDAGGVPMCRFSPPSPPREAPILYFHGGGYVCGSVHGARGVAASLANAFYAPVFAVGYRQAPENPFPAAVEDAVASYRWLAQQCAAPITLIGDSAGAGLAVTVALEALRLGLRAARGTIAICGVFDMAMSGPSWSANQGKDFATRETGAMLYRHYLNGADSREPLASPAYRDLRGAPPLLVMAGSHEVMLSDSEMLVAQARSSAVPTQFDLYWEMPHNFVKFAAHVADFAITRMVHWESRIC